MAAEVDFHCDLIAQLPLEINQIIFQQLPLRQIFQARSVSRAWRDALTDPDLVHRLLRAWYPAPHVPVPNVDGRSAEQVSSLNAEHVDAYRRGKAFSMRTHCTPSFSSGLDTDCIAYADAHLSWVDPAESSTCRKLDVRTGDTKIFVTEDRSRVCSLALSTSMVAVASMSGKCYVWMLKEQNNMSLRLPSPWVLKILLTSNTVVIAFYHPGSDQHRTGVDILTWTPISQKTQSFAFDLQGSDESRRDIKVMLDNEGRSVVFVERQCANVSEGVERVYFTRASLNGIVQAQGMTEGPLGLSRWHCASNTTLAEVNHCATIWAYVGKCIAPKATAEVVRVRYNFSRDRIEYETDVITGIDKPEQMAGIFFYKQVAYYPFGQRSSRMLAVVNFDELICSLAPMSSLISWASYWPNGEPNAESVDFDGLIHLFGDENFLVHECRGNIVVWNFDRDCKMTEENIPYRTARQEKRLQLITH